jgi:tubulin--tyrosine ligase
MHILVTNDDGPPSSKSSPYVLNFVRALQANGHTVSVCIPNTQRSWIGKAHIVGQSIRPSYYRPPLASAENKLDCDEGKTSEKPLPASSQEEEWILVDSTPASCIQIGLYHYFKERGPFDLVISGPNYGRNTTAVFALSSGTLGGALEAAVCGVRAIALSYAFFDRNHDPDIIAGASKAAVRVVEALFKQWDDRVGVYTVNVPLLEGAESRKVMWTNMLQNRWTSGSCFTEVDVPDEEDKDAEEVEAEIRRSESMSTKERPVVNGLHEGENGKDDGKHLRYNHKHFKWTPRFKDVYDSVERAGPGNDGWTVKEGMISVTPLQANFMHVDGYEGEVKI